MAAASVTITAEPFDPEKESASFRRQFDRAGGIVLFVGQVRAEAGHATRLALEHYPGYTERQIARLCGEAAKRWVIDGARVIHRVGEMAPGEAIVLVAAAAAHRRDAFETVDFLMDYLKSGAPFWKREFDGRAWRWIEPRAQDHRDKTRWSAAETQCLE